MTRTSSRSGSALLIVLGMLSFMIISAVGFAAYMRFSRQPSSFLRRSSSTRQLIKAALAEAINEIDVAIGNNPHPGIGRNRAAGTSVENCWEHRIFTGTNVTLDVTSDDIGAASPLCLEALAYIPPALVNEARFYARHTPTARWKPLGFDTGRYSWLAIDVSDYFDVNRLLADVPRSSAAGRRVTLAHLFEGPDHTSAPSGAAQWDKFMEKFRGQQDEDTLQFDLKGREPLISLADFNLAFGANGKIGDMRSPFYTYLTGSGNNGFYNINAEKEKEAFRQMTFVTDSLQKPVDDMKTENGEKIYDLADGKNQPFQEDFLKTQKPALSDCVFGRKMPSDGWMKWVDHLSGLGCAALYDYLDPDHVPISLAIPTTERVPMFCGIQPNFTGASWGVRKAYKFENNGTPKRSGDQDDGTSVAAPQTRERTCKQTVYYRVSNQDFLKGFQTGDVRALVCFPFNHADPTDKAFTTDGRFSFFLTTGDVSLRTGTSGDPYHLTKMQLEDKPFDSTIGLISAKLGEQQVSFAAGSIVSQEDAVKPVSNPLISTQGQIGAQLSAEGNELLRVDYVWTQNFEEEVFGGVKTGRGTWNPSWDDAVKNGKLTIDGAHCGLPATVWQNKTYQRVDGEMANDKVLAEFLQKGGSKTLTLRAAAWLRVKNADNKVVDMVPACLDDDAIQNQVNDPYPLMKIIGNDSLGRANPLMLFNTGVTFEFSIAGLDDLAATPKPIEISPKQAIVSDPRYNHAPEHWFKIDADLTPANWLQHNQLGSSGKGRDNDIFMATSDAGYLQSRYEIAFLPRFSELTQGGDTMGRYQSPDGAGVYTSIPDSFGGTRNQDMVWRTYDPFSDNTDAFYDLPWRNLGTGQTINPYSDSTNVLMAAFANTPIDWKHASTNVVDGGEDYVTMKVADFNKKYAFNEYAPKGQRLAWIDLEEIAGRFMSEMRKGNQTNWEDVWDDLGWGMNGTQSKHILGFDLDGASDDLWTVDRKFLHGFWRDCFAARQQLFLVFVRAEPMMMGSEGNGQVPPQLGARAMAVVWRDPTESKNDKTPHQTRVLFYRQFE